MRFCGLAKKVVLFRNMDELSSKQGTFDIIYTESVLTILNRQELKESLFQIRNLLKPGGRLVCNETIWVDDIPVSEKLRINQTCQDNFGIVQCSLIFSDLQNAISIMKENGFYLVNVIGLDNFGTRVPRRNFIEYRSTCFSWLGKLMSYFSRVLQQDRMRIQKTSKDVFLKNKKYLSGQLLEVRTANY
jgi:SAM-dependent methyltransferase